MPPGFQTTFSNVLVLRRSDAGWFCEIEDRQVFLAQRRVSPGTHMPSEGRRGPVSVTAEGADEIRRVLGPRSARPRAS
jgi:hypothetical protein